MSLRSYRESLGLSISQAAAAVGVTHETWRRWEHGERTPSLEVIAVLSEWSGGTVTARDFTDGDEVRKMLERLPAAGFTSLRQGEAA